VWALRRVQENQDGLKLNGTHQFVFDVDDVNILGGSVSTVLKDTEALIVASKEIRLQVNADKIKYIVMSRDQNAGRSHNIKIANNFFEKVEEFKYLGTNLTNQNYIQEEIKSRMKSGNACYYSVQKILSSSLLSKNTKIKIYRTIILPLILDRCETWSFALREKRRLRLSENSVLRRIFRPKGDEVIGEWRKLHDEELNYLYSPNIFRVIKSTGIRWAGHVARMWERRGLYSVLVGKPERKSPLGRPSRRWEDNIKMYLQGVGCEGMDWINLA
jgi:hypothetical protein